MLAYSKPKHPIAFIILALILEITIIVFYGIFGNITMNDSNLWNQSTSPSSTNFYYFFLMNLNNIFFALILLAGFGLVMVYIKHTAWNALGFSLLITCICIQLYPLISTFWNNVFVNAWGTGNVVIDPSVSMNGSIRVAISMLVVLATLIGRIGLLDTLIVGVVGTIVYSLNIALNVSVAKSRSADANINDVGGAMDIFLFGGVLAVVIGRFLRTMNTLIHPKFSSGPGNQHPILAFIGTIFIWSGFSYLSINSPETQYFMDLGVMNSYLCLASCVVTICAMSSIIHLRIGILEIIFGTISGGVIIGSCSMIIVNPAISILLGIIAGSLTYVYLHFLHKWVNRDGVVDSTGVIGVYIVNGVISPVFSAILIACYSTYPTWKPLFLGVTIGVDGGISNATFQLIHLGITAGVAILAGIMLGWVLKWIGSKEEIFELFEDSVEFSNYQLTTMPTMIFPPPIRSSRVGNPMQENSSARLFGQNITAMTNNHQPQLPPLSPIKYVPQNISRPMTPPLQSRPVTPGRPITPVRSLSPIQNLNQPVNLNSIQTRSILYNENIPQVIPQSFPHFTPQHAPQHIPQTIPVSVQSRVVPFQPITTVPPPPSMYNPQPTHTNIFTLPPLQTPSNISNRY